MWVIDYSCFFLLCIFFISCWSERRKEKYLVACLVLLNFLFSSTKLYANLKKKWKPSHDYFHWLEKAIDQYYFSQPIWTPCKAASTRNIRLLQLMIFVTCEKWQIEAKISIWVNYNYPSPKYNKKTLHTSR